jgi:hypothetical protein
MKIRPVGAELFHAGGRTDMTKLTVAFRNFAKAPKIRYAISFKSCEFTASRYSKKSHFTQGVKTIGPCCTHVFSYVDEVQHKRSAHNAVHRCEFRENWFPKRPHFSCGGK